MRINPRSSRERARILRAIAVCLAAVAPMFAAPALSAPPDDPPPTLLAEPQAIPSPSPAAKPASTPAAQTPGAPAGPRRPRYVFRRWEEDWSVLAKADRSKASRLDGLKYIPFGNGSNWLSLGGHVRERVEAWESFRFGNTECNARLEEASVYWARCAAGEDNDIFLLSRHVFHGDLHLGPRWRFFGEMKINFSSPRALLGGKRLVDEDLSAFGLEPEQLFVDYRAISDPKKQRSLTLRGGRQVLTFGKRLLNPAKWQNSLRRWDGVSVLGRQGDWNLHGFATYSVPVRRAQANVRDASNKLFGLYLMRQTPAPRWRFDGYWMYVDRGNQEYNRTRGTELRHTLGGRAQGDLGKSGVDVEVEAAGQFGSFDLDPDREDIRAWMFTLHVAKAAPTLPWKPRFFAGVDLASGDKETAGKVQTFNAIFPESHDALGFADVVGRYNVHAYRAGVGVTPRLGISGRLQWIALSRATVADAWYDPQGVVLRRGALGRSLKLGNELDFNWTWEPHPRFEILAGFSRFFAGPFIRESGDHANTNFFYTQTTFTF